MPDGVWGVITQVAPSAAAALAELYPRAKERHAFEKEMAGNSNVILLALLYESNEKIRKSLGGLEGGIGEMVEIQKSYKETLDAAYDLAATAVDIAKLAQNSVDALGKRVEIAIEKPSRNHRR